MSYTFLLSALVMICIILYIQAQLLRGGSPLIINSNSTRIRDEL